MKPIISTEEQYSSVIERIEDLLPLVDEDTPADDDNSKELVYLSNIVADYEGRIFGLDITAGETMPIINAPDEDLARAITADELLAGIEADVRASFQRKK